jgi:hypothetical protein
MSNWSQGALLQASGLTSEGDLRDGKTKIVATVSSYAAFLAAQALVGAGNRAGLDRSQMAVPAGPARRWPGFALQGRRLRQRERSARPFTYHQPELTGQNGDDDARAAVTDLAQLSAGRLQPSAQPADRAGDMQRTARPALAAAPVPRCGSDRTHKGSECGSGSLSAG